MAIRRVVRTKIDENRDPGQLHIEEFLKQIEAETKISEVEIVQGVIEFDPKTGFWVLCTQSVLPFDIGGDLYQEYDVAREIRARARERFLRTQMEPL